MRKIEVTKDHLKSMFDFQICIKAVQMSLYCFEIIDLISVLFSWQ